jgi:dTDP-4-amino-4,6-dideoxygalactose transaminase
VKLRHLDDWTAARQRNADRYRDLFADRGLAGAVTLPPVLPHRGHVFNQFCVRIPGGRRDEVLQSLRAQQVGCAIYYPIPLHLQECFAGLGYSAGDLPQSERAAREVLALPIYPEVTEQEQARVVDAVAAALGIARGTAALRRAA